VHSSPGFQFSEFEFYLVELEIEALQVVGDKIEIDPSFPRSNLNLKNKHEEYLPDYNTPAHLIQTGNLLSHPRSRLLPVD